MGTSNHDEQTPHAAFARGMSGPFGPYNHAEAKTHLDERTHTLWLQLCNSKDTTSSELLRDVIYLLVHKKTPAEFTADDRRELLDIRGPNAGLAGRLGH
jgi:hypothetical protein